MRLSKNKRARRLCRLLEAALPKAVSVSVQETPPRQSRRRSGRASSVAKDVPLWAIEEVKGVALGDARLNRRLSRLLGQLASQPTATIPQACETWADTKAAYRFFDNGKVTPEKILQAHQSACIGRIENHPVVLAVQDTTSLDFTHHPNTSGLGPIEAPTHQGLLVHSTLAVSPEGVPLGLLDQQVWTRDPKDVGVSHRRRERPFEDKESHRWLSAEQAMLSLLPERIQVVTVADREADIYDLFAAPRRQGAHLLIRAAWDRRVENPQKHLWATLKASVIQGHVAVEVPRADDHPARTALLAVRFAKVQVCPPRRRLAGEGLSPVPMQAVFVQEEGAPSGVEPISWMLLTTLPVNRLKDALQVLRWYTLRWLVERYHLVLKSGCRIEQCQLETGARLRRCLAVYAIVAWRLLWLTYVARQTPEASCEVAFTREEWQALYCVHHRVSVPPKEPPTLQEAICWVAQLGGFLARKGDGNPGVIVLWRGLRRLHDLTEMWRLTRPP